MFWSISAQDCPRFLGLPDYVRLIGGATLTAVGALLNDISNVEMVEGSRLLFISFCFHFIDFGYHAQKSCAFGFCYVADCILAILAIKRGMPLNSLASPLSTAVSKKPRIMSLDLDLLYSDAVSDAFYPPISFTPSQILVSPKINGTNITYLIFCRH